MPILDQLASSLGRRDETPNVDLAQRITADADTVAIAELAELLRHKKQDIRSDAVKVLYEIGERTPALIAPHATAFLQLLDDKNNRLVWGAMTALDTIAAAEPGLIFQNLGAILAGADRGSVIAKDHAVGILVKLAVLEDYRSDALTLLLDLMKNCAVNQFPMYCEHALPVVAGDFKEAFAGLLRERLDDMAKESQRKRVEKVLKRLGKD